MTILPSFHVISDQELTSENLVVPIISSNLNCCDSMIEEYAQCLRMDLNKKSFAKPKTIAGSKGTP